MRRWLLVILALDASLTIVNAGTAIWDFDYSCEPVGQVSTVTFQNPYKEPTNYTVFVNWGPHTQQHQGILKESERLSLHFTYPQNAAKENGKGENQTYYNRSFEFFSEGRLGSIRHQQKCAMYNGILQGNCCRPAQSFRTPTHTLGGLFEKFRNRNQKTPESIERWTGGLVGNGNGRHVRFTDPLAIVVAIAWTVFM
jgi:hypothetical protein